VATLVLALPVLRQPDDCLAVPSRSKLDG